MSGTPSGTPKKDDYTNVHHEYSDGNENRGNNNHNGRPPLFNGDPERFPWWKSKLYSYIIGIDDELWDIIEDGIDIEVDDEGKNADRKKMSEADKKIYKKHHKARGIMIDAILHEEFMRICNKATAKSIFDSLCSSYEGNQQVKEAKANMLVHQYELFKMSEDETIESMYTRFQTLVSGLQVLKKSYTTPDHVKKILRSLPAKWRPKVTAIEEARDLNTLSLENLISSLKCHELGFPEAESSKKSKSIALRSKGKEAKALKAAESEEEPSEENSEDSEDDEYALLTRRFQRWAGKNKKFSRSSNSKGSGSKKEEKNCYNCKKPGHFIAECPEMSKDKVKKSNFKSSNFKKNFRKSLMAAWDQLDKESDSDKEDDEEANLALMAAASSDVESECDSGSEEEDEVFSKLSMSELVSVVKDSIRLYTKKSKELKLARKSYLIMAEEVDKLRTINKSQQTMLEFMGKKHLSLKQSVLDGIPHEPVIEHELAFEEFMWTGLDRSKIASLMYHVSRNKGEGIGFTGSSHDRKGKCLIKQGNDGIPKEDILKGYKHYFGETGVIEEPELKCSESTISEFKIQYETESKIQETQILSTTESDTLKPQNFNKSESKVSESPVLKSSESESSSFQSLKDSEAKTCKSKARMNNDKGKMKTKTQGCSRCKQSNVKILKRPESKTLKSEILSKPESRYVNADTKRSSTPKAKLKMKPKANPKVLNKAELGGFDHNALRKKKPARTNSKGPIKIWVPKNEIVNVAGVSQRKDKATFMVPGQWLLATYDRRQIYVPNPEHERGRLCGFWRAPERQDNWYWYDR